MKRHNNPSPNPVLNPLVVATHWEDPPGIGGLGEGSSPQSLPVTRSSAVRHCDHDAPALFRVRPVSESGHSVRASRPRGVGREPGEVGTR